MHCVSGSRETGHQRPDQTGLRTPAHTPLESIERPFGRTTLSRALQALTAIASVAILGWCVSLAWTKVEHADAAAVLARAPRLTAALVLLTALSVVLSGMMFHAALAPAMRLSAVRVVGVNAVASLAAFLPFKISAFIRAAVHHRQDKAPIRLIVAWFATVGGVSLMTLTPFALLSLLLGEANALWWIAGLGAVGIATIAAPIVAARAQRSPRLRALSLGSLDLLASQRSVALQVVYRLLDGAGVAVRFMAAGALVGTPISASAAFTLAPVFVLVGSASPAGVLGAREGALTGMAMLHLVGGLAAEDVAFVSLTVTAAEALTHIILGSACAAALRLDKALRFTLPQRA